MTHTPSYPDNTILSISADFPDYAHIERHRVLPGETVEFLEDSGFEGEFIVASSTGFEFGIESRWLSPAA